MHQPANMDYDSNVGTKTSKGTSTTQKATINEVKVFYILTLCILDYYYYVTQFLAQNNRKIITIDPNGTCFFRGLSYQLFGTQEEHSIA